jgi:TetR/AcrR family transcriptional regulator
MRPLRSSPDTKLPNGDEAFLSGAALRQPADALGPRAHQTIARIIEATRDVFLTRGYPGTTIDEIARVAEVSRASFYTYFPSKREVLLAVGAYAASESMGAIEHLAERGSTRAGMIQWVSDYFDLLDVHGSFAFAWTQAAHEDEEIRTAGMKRHLSICRRFGTLLAQTAGRTAEQPAMLGLVAASALERSWSYSQLYADTIERADVIAQAAHALWGIARQPSPKAGAAG